MNLCRRFCGLKEERLGIPERFSIGSYGVVVFWVFPGCYEVLKNLWMLIDSHVACIFSPKRPPFYNLFCWLPARVRNSYWKLRGCGIAVNDKVCPQVGDHPGNLPVKESEVKDARREQIDQLITMGHSSWDGISRNAPWKEEVPQAWPSIVLKGVEVGFGIHKVVKLHELVGGGLDEEGAHHINEAVYHQLPVAKLVVLEKPVVDQLINDPTVLLKTKRLQQC